ncbi:MAG: GNAT family N-acetyltransferase [Deltaproteobacteria bacterium]|nr:GNAT family N-acetyltransferase [Deltaproteobacteria bacterium]
MHKRDITDLEACRNIWTRLVSVKNISDLWDFRFCFQKHYHCDPYFIVLEDHHGIAAMVPLSYVNHLDMYVFFPGETWNQKTWIERTPIYLRKPHFLHEALDACPERTYLRYMEMDRDPYIVDLGIDEIGYVFYPSQVDYDLQGFSKRFHNKKYKEIMKVIRSFADAGSVFHYNRLDDFNILVDMSLQRYGSHSYLDDGRFREGFRELIFFLHQKGWLRMVSLEIMGKTVAVDVGATYMGTYTVFLGGTDPDYMGVAKVMNMHHLEWACREKMNKVDFLCGDFHWKKLWHLDQEPLYQYITFPLDSGKVIHPDIPLEIFSMSEVLTHA